MALSDADIQAIQSAAPAWAEAANNQDAAGIVALYVEDAVELPPNLPLTEGRSAIHARRETELPTLSAITITSSEVGGPSSPLDAEAPFAGNRTPATPTRALAPVAAPARTPRHTARGS